MPVLLQTVKSIQAVPSVDIDDGQFVHLIRIDFLGRAKAEKVFVKRQERADIRVEASGQNSHNARVQQICRNNGCQCVEVGAFMGGYNMHV